MGQPPNKHVVGILSICLLYYAWTAFGGLVTKQYVYKYLNINYRGPSLGDGLHLHDMLDINNVLHPTGSAQAA